MPESRERVALRLGESAGRRLGGAQRATSFESRVYQYVCPSKWLRCHIDGWRNGQLKSSNRRTIGLRDGRAHCEVIKLWVSQEVFIFLSGTLF